MSSGKSFDLRADRAKDFLRYLTTENININGKKKEDVKVVYESNYKEYRRQIYSVDVNINFSSVIYTLVQLGLLHKQGGKLFLGPEKSPSQTSEQEHCHVQTAATQKKNTPTKKPASGQKKTSLAKKAGCTESMTPLTHTDETHGRARLPRVVIAVDQFLTANAKPKSETKTSGASHAEDKKGTSYICKICEVTCHSEKTYDEHLRGKRHRVRKMATSLHENREKFSQNKGGVTISALVKGRSTPITADSVAMELTENTESEVAFMMMNTHTDEDVIFVNCQMLNRVRGFALHDEKKVTDGMAKVRIQPGQRYNVRLTADVGHIGTFRTLLAFQFYNHSSPGKTYHIMRSVAAKCTNKITEEIKPKSEYKRPPRVSGRQNLDIETVIDGVKPPGLQKNSLEVVIRLDKSPVSPLVRKLVNRGLNPDNSKTLTNEEVEKLQGLQSLLEQPLEFKNYAQKFKLLLNVEEMQLEVDIRKYDLQEVTMTKYSNRRNPLLLLEVPGLAEKRPSVLKGDVVFVRINTAGKLSSKEYKGYVHETRLNDVALGFDHSLLTQFLPNMKFNVRFTVNRFPLLMGYRAVKLAQELSLQDILFPAQSACSRGTILPPEEATKYMHDQTISTNPKQLQAIQHIVSGSSRPAPYILFGPPGTGKTVTIVEAMKQIVRCIPTANILACAPSNSAADLITSRLLNHLNPSQVFRMYAASRPWKLVPEEIRVVANYDPPSGEYFFPTKADVMKYKVVVCTLVTAGRLASASFPPDHFTHVFIDEAGNAPEPECIVPLAGIFENLSQVKDGGQLVLAGDPKQLGPIIHSPIAIKHGLGVSLLERYMMLDIYARHDPEKYKELYNPRLITKLLNNYRSHPKILAKVNEMFYNGELIPCADPILSNRFCRWEMLPTRGFPIVFHGVSGREMREEHSPSFFNPEEVAIVLNYVENLLTGSFPGFKVQPKHIGVISPYMKQVEKLKQVIGRKNWKGIKVGSVEEYQGDERAAIIVSTVRSQPNFLGMDSQFRLGFLDNPKRFNVAVTRAKALLIIVGNPLILRRDKHWSSFLEYCQNEGGYQGLTLQPEEEDLEDMLQRFAAVGLSD